MSLSKHKSWDHEVLLLNDNSQSECHYTQWVKINSKSQNLSWQESQKEFIRSSKSSAKYSILFVSKKNDTKQLCVDYRQLNKITKQDSYFYH
jgi:hypothetical protein